MAETVPGTTSAFAERITGGSYLDIEPDPEQLARYGLSVGELQKVIGTALGGEMVTTTVEGRERFGVTVRYPRELRSSPQQMSPPRESKDKFGLQNCRWHRLSECRRGSLWPPGPLLRQQPT